MKNTSSYIAKEKNCMTAAGGQAMAMAGGNSVGDLARIERSSRYNNMATSYIQHGHC